MEIDQSGKIEQLDRASSVAFSNGSSGVVFLSAKTKREIINYFSKSSLSHKEYIPTIFAAIIFLLLQDQKVDVLFIDEEYTNKDYVIETALIKYFRQGNRGIPSIRFGRTGKHSPAHILAWRTFTKKNKTSRKITLKEVLKLLKK